MTRILVAEIAFSLAVFALQEVPRGHGFRTLAGVIAMLGSLPLLHAAGREARAAPRPAGLRALRWAVTVLCAAQLAYAVMRAIKPKVLDIATTTAAAILAVLHGGNPYALAIDPLAGGIVGANAAFHGYKYLPAMMLVYAPLTLALGIAGAVATNVVLQGATAAALRALAARRGGAAAGLAAALLYLSLPFPAFQLFTRGVNDLAAVLPLLLALLMVERRPGWAGALVGFSLAAKLMPGLAVLPCLVPAPGARRRYAAGLCVGLVPVLPFVLTAPGGFVHNILIFNEIRPIDDTSWLFGLPVAAVLAARTAAAAALVALYGWVWRRRPGLEERLAASAAAILLVFAVGPDMHHNYYLWFIPFMAVLTARAAI
jgi:Glycosyltransferase family 87